MNFSCGLVNIYIKDDSFVKTFISCSRWVFSSEFFQTHTLGALLILSTFTLSYGIIFSPPQLIFGSKALMNWVDVPGSLHYFLSRIQSYLSFFSERENGPRTVKDVKLISAGRILENNRTVGECSSPLCDVPGGVTTMHVVVQPPPPEKGKSIILYVSAYYFWSWCLKYIIFPSLWICRTIHGSYSYNLIEI